MLFFFMLNHMTVHISFLLFQTEEAIDQILDEGMDEYENQVLKQQQSETKVNSKYYTNGTVLLILTIQV